jgi:O-antigen ligase
VRFGWYEIAFILFSSLGVLAVILGKIRVGSQVFADSRFFFYAFIALCLHEIVNTRAKTTVILVAALAGNTANLITAFFTNFVINPHYGYLIDGRYFNGICLIAMTGYIIGALVDRKKVPAPLLIIAVFSFVIMVIDSTRSIYIMFCFGFFIALVLANKIRLVRLLKSGVVVLFILGAGIFGGRYLSPAFYTDIVQRTRTISLKSTDESTMFRLVAWHQGWQAFREHPLLGSGTGRTLFIHSPEKGKQGGYRATTLHNYFLQVLVIGGVTSLIFFCCIAGTILLRGCSVAIRTTSCLRPLNIGILTAAFSFIVGIFFTVYGPAAHAMLWFLLGFCECCSRLTLRLSNEINPVSPVQLLGQTGFHQI